MNDAQPSRRSPWGGRWIDLCAVVMAAAIHASAALAFGSALDASVQRPTQPQWSSLNAQISMAELPSAARSTLSRIQAGGPYPYERDGITFGNRERLIPQRARGYYHEFTVKTPGSRNRGARRIVCGGDLQSLADCYYSDDHYQSFRKIVR